VVVAVVVVVVMTRVLILPVQLDTVAGVEDTQIRVGRQESRHPGVLEPDADAHVQIGIGQPGDLAGGGLVGVGILAGLDQGLDVDVIAADSRYESLLRDHADDDRQRIGRRRDRREQNGKEKGDATQHRCIDLVDSAIVDWTVQYNVYPLRARPDEVG
jgi:hypothetical protein